MIGSEDEGDIAALLGAGQDHGSKRIEAGDGRWLEPFRWWHLFTGRTVFFLRLPRQSDTTNYAVDVRLSGDQAGDQGKAHLYRDGRHVAASELPSAFPIEGGVIEARLGAYGIRRMHYVDGKSEKQLSPHPRSAVGLRMGFEHRHPGASRWISVVSVALLMVGVGVNAPQLLETLSQVPSIAERVGSFHSPISLPSWLNLVLGVGAVLASAERGLRLRSHWLLDGVGN